MNFYTHGSISQSEESKCVNTNYKCWHQRYIERPKKGNSQGYVERHDKGSSQGYVRKLANSGQQLVKTNKIFECKWRATYGWKDMIPLFKDTFYGMDTSMVGGK